MTNESGNKLQIYRSISVTSFLFVFLTNPKIKKSQLTSVLLCEIAYSYLEETSSHLASNTIKKVQ